MERFRNPWFKGCITFPYCFLHTCPACNIITFDSQKLLKSVSSSVCLKCPHLHFTKPLPSELCLSSKRLLCNKRVRSYGAGMYFVVNKMVELHHVHISNGHRSTKWFTCSTVIKCYLPRCWEAGLFEEVFYLCFFCTLEYRSSYVKSECLCRPAKMCLEYLPNVHS